MTEEYDLPTEKPPEESPQVKQARLWLHLDKVAYKIEEAAKELRAEATSDEAPEKSVRAQIHAAEHANVNNVRIDLGGSTLLVVVLLVAIIGACGVVMGIDIAERSTQARHYDLLERQYRMVELKLDDWTVVAHRSGLVLPGDYTCGPQGNPDTESFTQPKGK
jgi:hypothetical protein